MACWNTIFVDVPITTLSPVKVVQDLLRPQHQPSEKVATAKKLEHILHLVLLVVTVVGLLYIYVFRQWPTPPLLQITFWLLFASSVVNLYTDWKQSKRR